MYLLNGFVFQSSAVCPQILDIVNSLIGTILLMIVFDAKRMSFIKVSSHLNVIHVILGVYKYLFSSVQIVMFSNYILFLNFLQIWNEL